jgi:hypothetical protein
MSNPEDDNYEDLVHNRQIDLSNKYDDCGNHVNNEKILTKILTEIEKLTSKKRPIPQELQIFYDKIASTNNENLKNEMLEMSIYVFFYLSFCL